MAKKAELEKTETLDWLCGQATHLANVYISDRLKFSKGTVERLFFEKIADYYQKIAYGACSLFEMTTRISETEFLPREMTEIKDYKDFIKKEVSPV